MKRRNFVRLIIAAVVGTVLVVEGGTLVELVRREILGSEDGDDEGDGADGEEGVGVGDEFLPGTPQNETLADGGVVTGEDYWTVRLTVKAGNPTSESYTLRLADLETSNGDVVSGNYTLEVPSGATRNVTGTWRVDEGEFPDRLSVEAMYGGTSVTEEIRLEGIPVSAE